jgi:hypothetical protein
MLEQNFIYSFDIFHKDKFFLSFYLKIYLFSALEGVNKKVANYHQIIFFPGLQFTVLVETGDGHYWDLSLC